MQRSARLMPSSAPVTGLSRVLRRAPVDHRTVLAGLEHEYTLWSGSDWLDARDVFDCAPPDGVRIDPVESRRFLMESGITLHADHHVAEVATPPVEVRPGCTTALSAWAAAGRAELAAAIPEGLELRGESTHISMSVPSGLEERLALLYAQTFAPTLMLLMDLPSSPGLLIRPRPGRIELCGEFVDGAALRAALLFVVGSVIACVKALETRDHASLPPALRVTLEPARVRFGWYIDRRAFGPDLYDTLRASLLETIEGKTLSAGDHLAESVGVALAAAESTRAERALLHVMARGDAPLPAEGKIADEPTVHSMSSSPYAGLASPRRCGDITLEPVAGTWDFTAFRARRNGTSGIVSIPAPLLSDFLDRVDSGSIRTELSTSMQQAAVAPVLTSWEQTHTPEIFSDIEISDALLPRDFMGIGNGVAMSIASGPQLLAYVGLAPPGSMSQVAIAEAGSGTVKGTTTFVSTPEPTKFPWKGAALVVACLVVAGAIGTVLVRDQDQPTAVETQPPVEPTEEPQPTPTEPEDEGFVLPGNEVAVHFTKGGNTCGFADRFAAFYRARMKGPTLSLNQKGTQQKLSGIVMDSGRFKLTGAGEGYVETHRGRLKGDGGRGIYTYDVGDCKQTWNTRYFIR